MSKPQDIRPGRRDFLRLALLGPLLPAMQNRPGGGVRSLEFEEAEPIIRSGKVPLPPGFVNVSRASWQQWVRQRDMEIRGRLQKGEEDTLANFVLFGTSFTALPRVTLDLTDPSEVEKRTQARVRAFVDAVAMPGGNERLVLLNALVSRLGYGVAPGAPRQKLAEYVSKNIDRYVAERRQYQRTDTATPAASDLYKERGLSLDTDFRPNYAIEAALADARRRGLLATVRRAAVIGPGLDFTDKDSGFDHYPLQTLQPFAVIDSLVRLKMASIQNLRVSVFDVSPSTLDHLSRAMARAKQQQGYTLQLVLDRARGWNPQALDYWERFGATIGQQATPLPLPAQVQGMSRRAVGIGADVVRILEPVQANIVLQRAVLADAQRYDLIIATNVLIYYDRFEQALALSNVESMLSTGGVFITNDLSQEYPAVRLRPSAVVRVPYAVNQEEQIQIYTRSNFQPQLPPA